MSLPNFSIELVESRANKVSIEDATYKLVYLISGPVNTDVTVQGTFDALIPTTFSVTSTPFGTINTVLQEYTIDPREPGVWYATAMYGRRRPRKTGDIVFTFDSSGGSEHIQISIKTVDKKRSTKPPGSTAPGIPDFQGAIGVSVGGNGEGHVAGTNIVVPNGKFTIEYYCPTSLVTPAYWTALDALVGHTNAAIFNFSPVDFNGSPAVPANEVLFLGGTGQPRTVDDWQIVLHFHRGKNILSTDPEAQVHDMVPMNKAAHDYYWAMFVPSPDSVAKVTRKIPAFAYVEQVYYSGDFTTLGPWSI